MDTEEILSENNVGDLGLDRVLAEGVSDTSGSDKIPADDSDTDEGLGGLGKSKSKQKSNKTRRARRKAFRPYYQLSEGERDSREAR